MSHFWHNSVTPAIRAKIGQSGVADKCVKMYSFLILPRLFTARYKNKQREKSFDFPSMRKVRDSNPRNSLGTSFSLSYGGCSS